MKRKLTYSLVLAIVLLLIAATALAVALLSPKEIVEQVAVPVAQNNDHENYTHEELAELIRTLNENGITLDEGSRIMRAFNAGHGYWEQDTIREICIAAFGDNERGWNIEQKHWYGEMMVSVGAWEINFYLIPEEGDISIEEAHIHAANALKETFGVELPIESNDQWRIYEVFELQWDEKTDSFPLDKAQWSFWYTDRETENDRYYVLLARDGSTINVEEEKKKETVMDEHSRQLYENIQTTFSKETEATEKYGAVMYFWPDEVKVEVYGGLYGLPYAIPEPEEYAVALKDAERFIAEEYGADALEKLGDYKVGYLFQKLDDEEDIETKATQLMWDIMFTTDPEFLSDGYRVKFNRVIHKDTGEEEITELSVAHAHLGSG